MTKRPDFIRNWRAIEAPLEWGFPDSSERFGYPAFFSGHIGMSRLKVAHQRLPPGRRSHLPGAYKDEEEVFFVLAGAPDLWVDGNLYGLREGDSIAIRDNTGLSHALINNSDEDVRLFVFGEGTRMSSQFFHPLASEAASTARLEKLGKLWTDPPKRKLGPNSGKPGDVSGRKRGRPEHVVHWRDILTTVQSRYPDSDEDQGFNARFDNRARLSRIGLHVELLQPGQRSSWPHAERDEDEFAYVVAGSLDAWNEGRVTPVTEGDFVGWRGGLGVTHVMINNSDEDAVLLVGGERSRLINQYWYPFHPSRNKEIGKAYWADHPKPKMGPHDGLPDRLRARVPVARRKDAVAANEAARFLGKRKKTKKKTR